MVGFQDTVSISLWISWNFSFQFMPSPGFLSCYAFLIYPHFLLVSISIISCSSLQLVFILNSLRAAWCFSVLLEVLPTLEFVNWQPGGLHQACRQPLLSPMSLIMTAPSLFFRSANDLPFASPTFLKVCLSELLADPCCQQVVLRGWFCPMIHGTEKLLSDVVVVFITINSKTDAYLEIWYESLTLPFLVTSRENIFHYFII